MPNDIRNGVWVCIEGGTEYVRCCFQEYAVQIDPRSRYSVIFRRWHLIGLEVGISVASAAIRGEATGLAVCFNADVAARAKKDLVVGEMLEGEDGYTVYGIIQPAEKSVKEGFLPLGLASNMKLIRPVAKGSFVTWADINYDKTTIAYKTRRETEAIFF